ncbi:MAG TPA: DNA methyltransferase, partial [Blastocatellia bacterium]|nr:DNA methyltransferase [Blastocatellia bacterium]
MSSKRHHAEWLSLVEVSGPFLTMPVLERVFPQGLDAHDPEHYRNLRLAFEEWEAESGKPALHRAWIKYVLEQTLGLPEEVLAEGQAIPEMLKATSAEHAETLRPDFIVRNPEGVEPVGQARLLIQVYPPEQDLDKAVAERRWKASPATRMMELLHAADVRLGLVTNGERWMMVYAPRGETTGYASWYAGLWMEEKITLQAFRSLLGAHRFFNTPDDQTLDAMLAESAKHQQEVTDQLGYQVRRAVETLINSLDRADLDSKRELLVGVPETELYESALTVMMRLVFLFCAEERGLLLLGDPLYDQHYAVSTLIAQLQEAADQHGEEVLERRLDAWSRLLATFRAVYGGIEHERLKLPAYGGRLFDPDRFPFLEGRAAGTKWRETQANPLPVNNRTTLHLLRSLQYLEMQGEARRLSFRALDIEQIGHVYEGLLDHTAKRAATPVLGLIGPKGDEPEVALTELERMRAKGENDLIAFLREQTGKSENTLRRLLETELDTQQVNRMRAACGNDDALFKRIRPFAALVRDDSFDRPVVIPLGSVYVTAGAARRSSGTHYTQRSLTEPIVKHTLDPLVYVGPAEGLSTWKLRTARELLDLKICDIACGSGAFLVQACRYLAERLVEAWEEVERENPGAPRITPEGALATGALGEALIPQDANERITYAQRIIAQRCLYGIDKNPLAAEMAKLSLWLLTLAKDKPFEFLDHNIRCGDSL